MDVILHLGSHRTGSTTFQSYLRRQRNELQATGIKAWGPRQTRRGLFSGILPTPGALSEVDHQDRARKRLQMGLDQAEHSGSSALVISDENIIGSLRDNLRHQALYPSVESRLAAFARAFENRVSHISLSIRSQDTYWASCAAYGIGRGHAMLRPKALTAMVQSQRSWRDVITEVAHAFPTAKLTVTPYEVLPGKPDAALARATGRITPRDRRPEWLNKAPDTAKLHQILRQRGREVKSLEGPARRWQPFNEEQAAKLREDYADDMFWLLAGADGLARLAEAEKTEDHDATRAGPTLSGASLGKGHRHYDIKKRRLA